MFTFLEIFDNVAANGNVRTRLCVIGIGPTRYRHGSPRRTSGLPPILDEPLENGQHVEGVLRTLLAEEVLLALRLGGLEVGSPVELGRL